MSDKSTPAKPTLNLLEGAKATDLERMLDLYRKMTGKEPTAEEIAECKAILESPDTP